MQRTEKEIPNNENHTTYFTLSDNNYFYQLVYHNEGDFYELQRIKRQRKCDYPIQGWLPRNGNALTAFSGYQVQGWMRCSPD